MDRSVLEADPHAIIEGMIIGAKAIGAAQGIRLYPRRVPPGRVPRRHRHPPGPRHGPAGPGHPGDGLRFRPRDRPGRGRLRLGRGDGPHRLDRGPAGLSPAEAALPRPARPVGKADRDQQRRNLGQRPLHHPPRRGLVLRAWARRRARARRSSRSSARSTIPGSSKSPWASACATSSSASAAAFPRAASSRRSRSAARRAAASPRSFSTCPSITRA